MQVQITISDPDQVTEERVEAFKQDPQMMAVATRFVAELIERAKEEAVRRKGSPEKVEQLHTDQEPPRKPSRWHMRARGYFLRVFSSVCLCNTAGMKSS